MYNNRQPRKQSSGNSKLSFIVKKTSAEQLVDEAEEEDILSLSPQPSIISTVTHGATNKNSLHSAERDHDKSQDKDVYHGVSTTEWPQLRYSSAPILNFGDVLYGSKEDGGW